MAIIVCLNEDVAFEECRAREMERDVTPLPRRIICFWWRGIGTEAIPGI